jgi:hypothetical protein
MEVRVFQVDEDLDPKRIRRFRGLKGVDPQGSLCIDSNYYKSVYEADVKLSHGATTMNVLEDIYRQTNVGERPVGYTGHSLSVSDVVQAGDDFYFCDSIGFQKLYAFCPGGKPQQEEKFQVECEAMVRRLVDHIQEMDGDDLAALVSHMFVVDVSCDHDDDRGQLVFDIAPRPDADEEFKRHTYGSAKETFKGAIIGKSVAPKMG